MAPPSVLNIPDFFASALVYILRAVTLTSFVGLVLLPFVPSKQEQIIWVVPIYTVLVIHRLITYVSQLMCIHFLAH